MRIKKYKQPQSTISPQFVFFIQGFILVLCLVCVALWYPPLSAAPQKPDSDLPQFLPEINLDSLTNIHEQNSQKNEISLQHYKFENVETMIEKLEQKASQNEISIVWKMFGEDWVFRSELEQYCAEKFRDFIDFDFTERSHTIFEDETSKTWILYKNTNPNTYLISVKNEREDGKVNVWLGVFTEISKKDTQNSHYVVNLLHN